MKEKGVSPLVIVLAIILVVALVATVLYVTMRGDGGPEGPSDGTFNSLAECTGSCMKDFDTIFDALLSVLEVVDQPLRTPYYRVTYNRVAYTFAVGQDLDGDLLLETDVSGTISAGLGTELSDGMQPPNEVAAFSWTRTTDLVDTGRGTFSFVELSQSVFRMTITEETTVNCENSCELEFTSFGLHLNLTTYIPKRGNMTEYEYSHEPRGDPFDCVFTGVVEFVMRSDPDTLEGMMSFDGSDVAMVTGTYMGEQYDFTINLETFEVST